MTQLIPVHTTSLLHRLGGFDLTDLCTTCQEFEGWGFEVWGLVGWVLVRWGFEGAVISLSAATVALAVVRSILPIPCLHRMHAVLARSIVM